LIIIIFMFHRIRQRHALALDELAPPVPQYIISQVGSVIFVILAPILTNLFALSLPISPAAPLSLGCIFLSTPLHHHFRHRRATSCSMPTLLIGPWALTCTAG
jgi:hypothetical protein